MVTTACVFFLLVSLSKTVTWYQLAGDRLSYGKLGRRRREIPLADIAWQPIEASPQDDLVISLRGGHMLEFGQAWLPDVTLLRETIRQRMPLPTKHLEGELIRVNVATHLVFQGLIAALMLPVGMVGWLILAMAFHPAKLGNPWVFLPLGILVIGLVLLGLYYAALRPWWSCVTWFVTSPQGFTYRTVFSRVPTQRLWSEIDALNTFPARGLLLNPARSGVVRFRDGQQIRFDAALLQNATPLCDLLDAYLLNQAPRIAQPCEITSTHPLWPRLAPHLSNEERVVWVGQPSFKKLSDEVYGQLGAGILLIVASVGGIGFLIFLTIQAGDLSVLLMTLFPLLFMTIGVYYLGAPKRYRTMLDNAVYAVTDRRVLVLNGLRWSNRSALELAETSVASFLPEMIRHYQVVNRNRDISLGGIWRKRYGRRKGHDWEHVGLVAVGDLASAEQALRWLIQSTDQTEPAPGCLAE